MPVDSRCVPPGTCASAACEPGLGGAAADGCVVGSPQPDGAPCAEDANPCTVDVCRAGVCAHETAPDTSACAPVGEAFRQTLALEAITQGLLSTVSAAGVASVDDLAAHLTAIGASLDAAERALAGDTAQVAPEVARMVSGLVVASGVPASLRARIAFKDILRTPREVAAFLDEVSRAQDRARISRSVARMLRRGGRRLLAGTLGLKADLRRLQRRTSTDRARPRRHRRSGVQQLF